MALVPWKYSNPFVDRRSMPVQEFTFAGKMVQITQDTTAEIDRDHNTGLRLWDGAYLLAKYLELGASMDFGEGFMQGKDCIELGCGCGLAGIVAWLLGAAVTLTDLEDTVSHTTKNLDRNKQSWNSKGYDLPSADALTVQALSWGAKNYEKFGDKKFHVIIGSDIIYQPEAVDFLLETLDRCSTDDATILIAYKPRGLGEKVFFEKLPSFSFKYSTVSKSSYPEEFCNSDYVILNIKRQRLDQ